MKYQRMTVSFEIVRILRDVEPEKLFLDYDAMTDDNDKKVYFDAFSLADLEHADVLDSITQSPLKDSVHRLFEEKLQEAKDADLGDQAEFLAFMSVLAERFFVTDITISRPKKYKEGP